MRKVFLMSALALGMGALGSGAAQANMTGDTMTPPAPHANVSVPDTANSLPRGAMTTMGVRAGNDVGTTVVPPNGGPAVTIR